MTAAGVVRDVISRSRPRGQVVAFPSRLPVSPLQEVARLGRELVGFGQPQGFGQAGVRGPFLTGKEGISSTEAAIAIHELESRNIFARAQSDAVTPEEAIRWGTDYSLYRGSGGTYREGFDQERAYQGSIRYTSPQYLTDANYIEKVKYAVAGARYVVGLGKATIGSIPRIATYHVQNTRPQPYKSVIRAALGIS